MAATARASRPRADVAVACLLAEPVRTTLAEFPLDTAPVEPVELPEPG